MLRSKANPVCRVFPGTHQQLSVLTAGGRRGVSLTKHKVPGTTVRRVWELCFFQGYRTLWLLWFIKEDEDVAVSPPER